MFCRNQFSGFGTTGSRYSATLEFRRDLWRYKTRFPGLSYIVVCTILRLAVLVQYRRVVNGWADRRTETHSDIYRASIASSGIEIKIMVAVSFGNRSSLRLRKY